MGTHIYKTKDGKRVPGTTTIISRFKDSGGLIHWAWQLGSDGEDYSEARDAAASAGTLVHTMVERHFAGQDPYAVEGEPMLVALARKGFEGVAAWADQSKIQVTVGEQPLVSERHRFGGTPDAIGLVCGR